VLGDIHFQYVWRFLRAQKIDFSVRKSWCASNDPDFVAKAAEIVGLYMAPPEGAIVPAVDEKPSIQALERAWLSQLAERARHDRQSHDDKRHGTTTLFAALDLVSGKVVGRHYKRGHRVFPSVRMYWSATYPPAVPIAGIRRVHIVSCRPPVSAPIARTGRRHRQLFPDQCLDEATHFRTQLPLDQIKPIVENLIVGHSARRFRGIIFHGVISIGALTPISFLKECGDYATFKFRPLLLRHFAAAAKSVLEASS
jgi:hypothetical protein